MTLRKSLSAPAAVLAAAAFVVGCTSEIAPTASTTEAVTGRPVAVPRGASSSALTDPPFDRLAAARALGGIDVAPCKTATGPTGPGHVTVTFEPGGQVSMSVVDVASLGTGSVDASGRASPVVVRWESRPTPFAGTPEGACIAAAFSTATVPPYSGLPVRVGKAFVLR